MAAQTRRQQLLSAPMRAVLAERLNEDCGVNIRTSVPAIQTYRGLARRGLMVESAPAFSFLDGCRLFRLTDAGIAAARRLSE